jgi:hypothetical protein
MSDVETLCFSLAFLLGIAGGWELAGYQWMRRVFEYLKRDNS